MNSQSSGEHPDGGSDGRQLGRRERELLRRVEDIIEAAEAVFAEKGYVSATMEEIAQKAEFAVGTIYKFFPGKGELYAETVRRGILVRETQVYEALASGGSPRDQIARYVDCRLAQFWEKPNFFRLFFQGIENMTADVKAGFLPDLLARYEKLKDRLRSIFAEGIRQGDFRRLPEDLLTVTLEGMIKAYVVHLIHEAAPSRKRSEEQQLLEFFLRGAAGNAGSSEGVH